jgi:hypothetical protein
MLIKVHFIAVGFVLQPVAPVHDPSKASAWKDGDSG